MHGMASSSDGRSGQVPSSGELDCYQPISGGRRCRFFRPDGACDRPTGFMCWKWLSVVEGNRPGKRPGGEGEENMEAKKPKNGKQGAESGYKNEYVSYSRIDQYKKCPKAFEFSYIQGKRGDGTDATRFGSACHAALEDYFNAHAEEGGPVNGDELCNLFQKHWGDECLTDQALFDEGITIMRRFAAAHPPLEPLQVRGCEVPFDLPLGRFRVKGFIDRVDDLGNGILEIIDYKTNKQPYSDEELESSMQLGLYEWVCRQLFPWAKRFVLSYWMLRMGYKQTTSRTPEQLDKQIRYFEAMAESTERPNYPAKLNALCGWCDHRDYCEAFQDACKADATIDLKNQSGLDALVARREALAGVMNGAKNSKDAIDARIKTVLDEQGDFTAGGKAFRYITKTTYSYDLPQTVNLLTKYTGLSYQEVMQQVCSVDAAPLKKAVAAYGKTAGQIKAIELQAELEGAAKSRTTKVLYSGNAKEN